MPDAPTIAPANIGGAQPPTFAEAARLWARIGLINFGGPAGQIAGLIARKVLEEGLAEGIVLNVNIPYLSVEATKGFIITRQGLRVYRDALDRRVDPRGRPYYWIGGEAPTGVNEEGTDVGALSAGYVSITPLQLDLTHYKAMEKLKSLDWEIK